MGKIGCSINGTLDDSKFNEPMPWIGIYVAAASAACALAMAIDVFRGFRYRKFWFPCKFFSLNATTLTLIGVAIKLAVDLNTSMPRPHDQLAKLSSTTFICTAIGNFLPSLGTMGDQELMMNVVALGILVITVIVNIGIQLGTGVIYVFWKEHAIIMFLMVILFSILVSSALTIPSTKSYFDLKYRKKYKRAMKECDNNANPYVPEKLRDDLTRYWMMANTCNPQFVIGRIATCTASGAFCLLSAVTLTEATLRNYLTPWSFKFCEGESDYKWSTTLIFVTQAIAVGVGTLAPASRWFTAIKLRCPKRNQKNYKAELAVENYWIRILYEWRDCPLNYRIFGRNGRKIMHVTKNKVLNLCIWVQKAMVLLSKSVRLISILFISRLLIIIQCCKKLICLGICNKNVSNFDVSNACPRLELRNFVLYLEGEEELIDIVTESDRDATGHWIRMGKKKQPRNLIKLLEKLNSTPGFEGVKKFDSDQVSPLDSEEPPNCWALPVVTLTSIAVAIGNSNFDLVKELINSVHQGLEYIRVIENNLNTKTDTLNSRQAAEIVWVGVDLHYRWLDVDLRLQGKSSRDIITELSDAAKQRFTELRKSDALSFLRDPSRWPNKVLAASSMYRTCQTLVLSLDNKGNECRNKMFEVVSGMIADVIGACLTNLPRVISMKCHHSTIEERERSVRNSILLLGKTEKILEILNGKPLPALDPDEMASIDEWRALTRKKVHYPCADSSSGNCDLELLSSSDSCIMQVVGHSCG